MPFAAVALLAAIVLGAIFWLVRWEERLQRRASVPRGTLEALWDGRERRVHPRWLFACPLQYRVYPVAEQEPLIQAHVWDASAGGVAARLPERLAPGAWLELEIQLPAGRPVKARGEVRWNRELPRAHVLKPREFLTGIQFRTIAEEEINRLITSVQQRESA